MTEDKKAQINENHSQNNAGTAGFKSDCQLLGFLPPGGMLVMSQDLGTEPGRGSVIAMPIAELFVQHKRRPPEDISPRARVS